MSNLVRLVRPINDSPAMYVRPGYSDHRLLCQLLSEGRSGFSGAVFDAAFIDEQKDLVSAINGRNLWSVLDTKALELSTVGGFSARRRTLPWAEGTRPHVPSDFHGGKGKVHAERIFEFVVEHNLSAVLAPTHFLANGFSDPWFGIDLSVFEHLRYLLDGNGQRSVAIYYPLCVPTTIFFDPAHKVAISHAFKGGLRPDAIWLRIHPFGGHSGHVNLENYIHSARELQELGVPLVGEKVGAVGSALLAFGALGGLDIGVSSGEKFDFKRLLKKPDEKKKGFSAHRGVLVNALGLSLDAKVANTFFSNRTLRAQYSCHDTECCRNGFADTLKDPRRHYVLTRMKEMSQLGTTPFQDRPSVFLEKMLRPATDKLGRVAQAEISKPLKEKIDREQRKLSGWRNTLGELSQVPLTTPAQVPKKRIEQLKGAA